MVHEVAAVCQGGVAGPPHDATAAVARGAGWSAKDGGHLLRQAFDGSAVVRETIDGIGDPANALEIPTTEY